MGSDRLKVCVCARERREKEKKRRAGFVRLPVVSCNFLVPLKSRIFVVVVFGPKTCIRVISLCFSNRLVNER